ncbi:hypothetical protein J1N35_016972 [Gossypium stocksii]|uniref:Mitochondrial carrier protein n=1 Tax=Gossypium stocksii TaxID=47602 RepID=A0A9D3VMN7_9ROSI|nr:hypothetical protein J1N35_016972 [Gossypium stocksii]
MEPSVPCLTPGSLSFTPTVACPEAGSGRQSHSSPPSGSDAKVPCEGLTGLYRGIGSNIVSSGPISALYTSHMNQLKGLCFLFSLRKALVGIMRKGGLPSIYTGWGAVLCRNVPRSIIEVLSFYINCVLVCGSLAASTAALFTTPFDVVKTKLQTQIPGSLCQYNICVPCPSRHGGFEAENGLIQGQSMKFKLINVFHLANYAQVSFVLIKVAKSRLAG